MSARALGPESGPESALARGSAFHPRRPESVAVWAPEQAPVWGSASASARVRGQALA